MTSDEAPTQFRLAGYIPLREHGFALPAYLGGTNWPSIAVAGVEGDHRAAICRFERWESNMVDLHSDILVSPHDPWHDVFLWKDRIFSGTPGFIFEASRLVHDVLMQETPLAFLDLALAADAAVAPKAAERAFAFLTHRFGAQRGGDRFRSIVVRPGVLLELHRALHWQGLHLPTFARDFALIQNGHHEFTVELARGTASLLSPEVLRGLTEGIERFGTTIGARLRTVALEDAGDIQPEEEEPVAAEPVQAAGGVRRTPRAPWSRSRPEFAIDIGTQSTRILERGKGLVLTEPSVVAIEAVAGRRKIRTAGEDALDLAKKDPSIVLAYPMRDGAVTDFTMAESMLRHFMGKVIKRRFFQRRPEVVISVPLGSTSVERRALRDAVVDAGAGRVFLIEEPLAAAIGAGMPADRPIGSLVVDIGSGRTEVAVVSVSGIAYATAVRVGGSRMDEEIRTYIRKRYGLLVGNLTAERIKKQVGCAKVPENGPVDGMTVKIRGRDLHTQSPKEALITQGEIANALAECVNTIVEGVRIALENTAPELSADIADEGIVLTGGGALLLGLDVVLREATGLAVTIAEDPLSCVSRGLARVMEDSAFDGALLVG